NMNDDLSDLKARCESDPIFMSKISNELLIPWHPRFTYFWKNISADEALFLFEYIEKVQSNSLPADEKIKKILEKLLVLHTVEDNKIVLNPEDLIAMKIIAEKILNTKNLDPKKYPNALSLLQDHNLPILDKYTCFIGTRMGRPEKAKQREMKPKVHVLFPMGEAGKQNRSITRALDKNKTFKIEAVTMYCKNCNEITYSYLCPKCGSRTTLIYMCGNQACNYFSVKYFSKCPKCGSTNIRTYKEYNISFRKIFRGIEKKFQIPPPKDLRCVIGLISKNKVPEPLVKGFLRAKYDLWVFRDGTIRFDYTNAPTTHFTPAEIGVSIDKLKKLGYTHDIYGNPLEREDQILELKVQDIIISEESADYLIRISKFIDELLVKVYKLKPYYNVKTREDLIGHLVIGLAPHTSAGIIGRILGFTKARCLYAHPYWHAAKRRNCDGDEDAIILLLDGLINFSREYLPKSRGGQMDAPLIVTIILNPLEVDSEVYNMDTMDRIPLQFYRLSQKYPEPGEIEEIINNVEKRLTKPEQYEGLFFTHNSSRIDNGPIITTYVKAKSMDDKIRRQINLMKKIIALDFSDGIGKILEGHILRDIFGNLRSFGIQAFKCTKCRQTIRRLPLNGKCPFCGEPLKPSVYKNMVLKYFSIAQQIVKELNPQDFRAQQFNRFIVTDFRVLDQAPIGELATFLNKKQKKSTDAKDKKVFIRKTKVELSEFW
ncbi:MAG: DNA polymerase II large subunit, partial [Candidatus Njordarchaeota archaeon]